MTSRPYDRHHLPPQGSRVPRSVAALAEDSSPARLVRARDVGALARLEDELHKLRRRASEKGVMADHGIAELFRGVDEVRALIKRDRAEQGDALTEAQAEGYVYRLTGYPDPIRSRINKLVDSAAVSCAFR